MAEYFLRQSDSTTYKKVFEFIKENGTEPFEKLFDSIKETDYLTVNNIDRVNLFDSFNVPSNSNNIKILKFLRMFKNGFLNHSSITSVLFKNFIQSLNNNMDKIDLYIENSKLLENLDIRTIDINMDFPIEKKTEIYYNENIEINNIKKFYTDGCIEYKRFENLYLFKPNGRDLYETNIENYSWIIQCQNHWIGSKCKYAYINDFGFDSSNIPSKEELESLKEPLSLTKIKNHY